MEPIPAAEARKGRLYKCDVCGHVWRSYGTGQRVVCPACYEKRTGHKMGRSPEHMAAMREKLAQKRQSQEPVKAKTEENPQQEEVQEKGSFWSRFLNKEVF